MNRWRFLRSANSLARRLLLIFALAVAFNYAWELAQTPLYAGVQFAGAIWHCFIASLGDGFLVLFIFAVVAGVMRSLGWYMRPAARSYLAMAAAGLGVSLGVEWWGLHIARRWEYSEFMPIIPGTGIGVVPVLQMLLLPPAIFWIARRLSGAEAGGKKLNRARAIPSQRADDCAGPNDRLEQHGELAQSDHRSAPDRLSPRG